MNCSNYYTPLQISEFLEKEKNVYFIGIGGVSMSSLAKIVHKKGIKVSGSDRTLSTLTDGLEKEGITVYEGHSEANCKNHTVFVYNAAIKSDNPEYAYAVKNGYPLIRRADFLGFIVTFYKSSVGVAGTHGKSTSTAMLGSALTSAGLDPTVLNGAVIPELGSCFREGQKDVLVFEACEYTDSFLSFYPTIATVLNVGYDHADYFETVEKYISSFKKYLDRSPMAVVNIDSENAVAACKDYGGTLIKVGLDRTTADVYAENIVYNDGYPEFDAMYKGELYAHIKLSVIGRHNLYNALCCIGACILLGADKEKAAAGISSFRGVQRRFEYKGKYNGASVYDDYAHHPDEIQATLSMARACTRGKIYVAFQPHTYTRTAKFYNGFINAFEQCDEVIFCDIYAARETDTLGMSAQGLANGTKNGSYKGDIQNVSAYLKQVLKPGDAAVIMGAGNANAGIIKDLIGV